MSEVNSQESIVAAEGTMDDFADAADLVDAIREAESNGDALGLVLAYRQKVRITESPQYQPIGMTVGNDKIHGWHVTLDPNEQWNDIGHHRRVYVRITKPQEKS